MSFIAHQVTELCSAMAELVMEGVDRAYPCRCHKIVESALMQLKISGTKLEVLVAAGHVSPLEDR